ncbi:MAG: phthalate transporter [Brevundimonas sp.]|nr:MAG: phthalate transporter [Brevundimonas sp.]
MIRIDSPKSFPGQTRVSWRKEPYRIVLAAVAGALWPPLVLTLPFWPPHHWIPGLEMDWRLLTLFLGLLAVPAGFWALDKERRKIGRPATRLGVVWRFMFYGGLAAAAASTVVALGMLVTQWISSQSVGQALGSTASTLLIYGVGGIPVSVLVGVSWALWAGLCAAFIAFQPQPEVKDRLGVMGR